MHVKEKTKTLFSPKMIGSSLRVFVYHIFSLTEEVIAWELKKKELEANKQRM